MRPTHLLLTATAGFAVCFFQPTLPASAQSQAVLSGQVSSAEEGAMEGVVVSARKDGATVTISVVTDAQGRYSFPASKLEPGHYALAMKAVGYDLAGTPAADVAAGKTASADLKLTKTKNLTAQLSNAEWLQSVPGTQAQKQFLLNCTGCHTLERIVKSTHDAEEFAQVIQRMSGYYPGSTPTHPQRLTNFTRDRDRGDDVKKTTEWLASINLSQQSTWDYKLQTFPRLTGKSTHVVFTEYDLPNPAIQPHDVMLDSKGNVWYSDFGQMFLGKMDAKTGKVTQYPVPESKKGFPVGSLNLEIDKSDNIWLGAMYQAEIVMFDPKTDKFQSWAVPKEWDTNGAQFGHLAVDGTPADNKVWIKNSDGTLIYRLDLASGKFENLGAPSDPTTGKKIGTYGLHADKANNIYLLDFSSNNIGRIDAKTKALTVFKTPTANSHPRRGHVDDAGKVWFAEYLGDAIGVLDPKSEKITEWKVPTPWSAPYDAMAGTKDEAWTGSMLTDRVSRLDVKSGQYTEYQLPRRTNIRRVFVDDTHGQEVLWIGSNHNGTIVKVEPQP